MYEFMKNIFMTSFLALTMSYARTKDKSTHKDIKTIINYCKEEDQELWETIEIAFKAYIKAKEKLEKDK